MTCRSSRRAFPRFRRGGRGGVFKVSDLWVWMRNVHLWKKGGDRWSNMVHSSSDDTSDEGRCGSWADQASLSKGGCVLLMGLGVNTTRKLDRISHLTHISVAQGMSTLFIDHTPMRMGSSCVKANKPVKETPLISRSLRGMVVVERVLVQPVL